MSADRATGCRHVSGRIRRRRSAAGEVFSPGRGCDVGPVRRSVPEKDRPEGLRQEGCSIRERAGIVDAYPFPDAFFAGDGHGGATQTPFKHHAGFSAALQKAFAEDVPGNADKDGKKIGIPCRGFGKGLSRTVHDERCSAFEHLVPCRRKSVSEAVTVPVQREVSLPCEHLESFRADGNMTLPVCGRRTGDPAPGKGEWLIAEKMPQLCDQAVLSRS